ncbi:DUF6355 family natural product biosynthesis protein [Streptomyces caniferus]|uniref:DUF6355 family natural product biosynthesis protein n=1 Tax=Streptomyces caniferus TaxID=285557 RepID=A0A640SBE2_9ACTN|nr:DUF6355 family natural product biosynthesis protein [Streptomyces caniferus]GFE08450.1 hypothetical protein Scani_47180 [Streptomyces caniferus]
MTLRGASRIEPARRRRRLGLAAVALAGALACSVAAPATAAAPAKINSCGWNNPHGEHAYYEHCATDTNVWIQVKRWSRGSYHRCVGPGRTVLDFDATGAWYDSNYRGGLCSHPGDTGP